MNDMLELMQDPHARHAMLVHWPIVLGLLGVVPAAVLLATLGKSKSARIVGILWFLLASGASGLAANSGEEAEEGVEHGAIALTEAEEEAVEHHEKLGHNGWMWMLIPAGLMGLTFVPGKRVRIAAASGGLAASLGVAGWVALTAHAGGELVYVQGLGVPDRGSSDPERSRPERDDDSDD